MRALAVDLIERSQGVVWDASGGEEFVNSDHLGSFLRRRGVTEPGRYDAASTITLRGRVF
jgi:hypothetical protein